MVLFIKKYGLDGIALPPTIASALRKDRVYSARTDFLIANFGIRLPGNPQPREIITFVTPQFDELLAYSQTLGGKLVIEPDPAIQNRSAYYSLGRGL